MNDDQVYCPLYKSMIEHVYCFDIVMVCTDGAPDYTIPKEIRNISNFKEICDNCKIRDEY